jgi:probable rRNA maturation factor
VITGDTELQQLNKDFLGIDSPTDVLSFPSDEVDPSTGKLYLGDIIISYPRAVQQAQGEGHPVSAELELLIIHGTLHLLGYDHGESEEKQRMWAVQTEILSATHNPIKTVPE